MSQNTDNLRGLDRILVNNAFFRATAIQLLISLPIFAVVAATAVGVALWMALNPPKPQYLGHFGPTGELMRVVPTHEPYVDDITVSQWLTTCIGNIYRFDFVNYREQFDKNQTCFTDAGFADFKAAIESKRLPTVLENGLVSNAVVTQVPVVIDKREVRGVHYWKVRVPIVITMVNKTRQSTNNVMLTAIVARVQPIRNPSGIAISQLSEAPM